MLKVVLLLSVLLSGVAFAATDSRVCAPFRDGVVDHRIVAEMLKAAKAGRLYRIHSTTSRVGFCVNSLIGRVEAEFQGFRGGLALRREVWGDDSQMLVMIDSESLKTKQQFIRDMIQSERFLHTKKFPKILFVSTALEWDSETTANLHGVLTMHGVSKPISFRVELTNAFGEAPKHEHEIVVIAKAFIQRSDFGMTSLPFFVDDVVELCLTVSALRYHQQ